MITIKCTKCKATLTMDDAFAGGVCRCQYCGTIQTVPSRPRDAGPSSGAVAKAAAGGKARSLYEARKAAAQAPGSGLDELGEIIASSGLTSSRLRRPSAGASATMSSGGESAPVEQTASPVAAAMRHLPILAGAGVAVLIVIGVMLWLLLGDNGEGTASAVGNGNGRAVAGAVEGPNFVGIPLSGRTVIYLLDRGGASAPSFGLVKEATYQSIESLGRDRRYQIIFWDNGSERLFPTSGPTPAGPEAVLPARQALEDVYAFGHTDIGPAIRKAMTAQPQPDEIVIVSAKDWQLGDEFVAAVRSAVEGRNIRLHCVSIDSDGMVGPMKAVAEAHGGQFVAVTPATLREMTK